MCMKLNYLTIVQMAEPTNKLLFVQAISSKFHLANANHGPIEREQFIPRGLRVLWWHFTLVYFKCALYECQQCLQCTQIMIVVTVMGNDQMMAWS